MALNLIGGASVADESAAEDQEDDFVSRSLYDLGIEVATDKRAN